MEGKREESWPAEPAEPGPRRKQEPAARPRSPKSSRREVPEPAREHPNRRTKGPGQAPHAMTTALAGWGGGGGKAGRAGETIAGKAGPCQPSLRVSLLARNPPGAVDERERTTTAICSFCTVTRCWQFPASRESSRVISW